MSDSTTAGRTDWSQILQLYDQLMALAPTPVVALNRAVAVAEVEGVPAALAQLDGLDLGGYHLFHATRAELLHRSGQVEAADTAYGSALALVSNLAERRLLEERRAFNSLAVNRPSYPCPRRAVGGGLSTGPGFRYDTV